MSSIGQMLLPSVSATELNSAPATPEPGNGASSFASVYASHTQEPGPVKQQSQSQDKSEATGSKNQNDQSASVETAEKSGQSNDAVNKKDKPEQSGTSGRKENATDVAEDKDQNATGKLTEEQKLLTGESGKELPTVTDSEKAPAEDKGKDCQSGVCTPDWLLAMLPVKETPSTGKEHITGDPAGQELGSEELLSNLAVVLSGDKEGKARNGKPALESTQLSVTREAVVGTVKLDDNLPATVTKTLQSKMTESTLSVTREAVVGTVKLDDNLLATATKTLQSEMTESTLTDVLSSSKKLEGAPVDLSAIRWNAVSPQLVANTVNPLVKGMAAMAQAEQALSLNQQGFAQGVVDKVMIMSSRNLQVAQIRLDPPDLGKLEIRVHVGHDQQTQVTFISPHAAVRDTIEAQAGRLRELFNQQGMNLMDVNVSDQSQHQERGGSTAGSSAGGDQGAEDTDELLVAGLNQLNHQARQAEQSGLVDYYA